VFYVSCSELKGGKVYKESRAANGKRIGLRSLRWEDLDSILEFAEKLFAEWESNPEFGVPLIKKPTLETEARWLADNLVKMELGRQIFIVAEVDGKLAGTAQVDRPENKIFHHYGRFGIAVAKEYRGIGLGSVLIKTILDECRKDGFKMIDLLVFANNSRAIHLYEKFGFKEVGKTPNKIYRDGKFIDDILMVIQL
jgi:ribosomal protein S18 acetylase RimI-like enzyme